jgi:5-formyltetrahydrofolate cyclo-ligase
LTSIAGTAAAEKARLRLLVRERLATLGAQERADADERVRERLHRLARASAARTILGYSALPDEVRVDRFLAEMVELGNVVLLPRIEAARVHLRRWTPDAVMTRDEKGVLAPERVEEGSIRIGPAMFLVPGRAFDGSGTRLGRGGGYYDRLLSTLVDAASAPPMIVGVSYELQILERIPREAHDRTVAMLVTEQRTEPTPGSSFEAPRSDGEGNTK